MAGGLLLSSIFAAAASAMPVAYEYGVHKVEARITGDDLHPGLTQIDSKTPGAGSRSASALVSDARGAVSASWSIVPLTAHEARVNIEMGYAVNGSTYAYSHAGQSGEVHFIYESPTAFTVNYFWDLTWDIYPRGMFDFNFFAQSVRLRIYDEMDNWMDYWVPPSPSRVYPTVGNVAGSTPIDLAAGRYLFIVFDSGSAARFGGEFESLSGNVYLDFDGGERTVVPLPAAGWLMTAALAGLLGRSRFGSRARDSAASARCVVS